MEKVKERKFRPVDYDPLVDSLFVTVPNRRYEHSIMVGDGLIIDLGRLPDRDTLDIVGFEILDASKKFGVDKYVLGNVKGLHAEITVTEEWIRVVVSLVLVHHRKEKKRSRILEVANLGIPPMASSINV